jgi:tRNA (guanine37-N1)-methyltransferase
MNAHAALMDRAPSPINVQVGAQAARALGAGRSVSHFPRMTFAVSVLTMFPDAFPGPLGVSLIGTAWREAGLWSLETVDIRNFSRDKRGFLDDTPFGGGAGQVLKADVIAAAVDSTPRAGRPFLYMSARGRPLTQARVSQWSAGPGLIVLCGRFEGVDQRVLDARGFEEVAVGDAVLAGGEAAAMVTVEACVRLLPGVLGQAASLSEESFEDGLLEHPQFTRPRTFEGVEVPDVLLSGHHGDIAKWRQAERERITRERRPDLWAAYLANQQRKGG